MAVVEQTKHQVELVTKKIYEKEDELEAISLGYSYARIHCAEYL